MIRSHRWWILLLATALAGCECGAGAALDAGADAARGSGTDAAVEDCGPAHPSVACVGGGWFELAKYWWYGESQLPPAIEPSPLADVHLPTFWIIGTR